MADVPHMMIPEPAPFTDEDCDRQLKNNKRTFELRLFHHTMNKFEANSSRCLQNLMTMY